MDIGFHGDIKDDMGIIMWEAQFLYPYGTISVPILDHFGISQVALDDLNQQRMLR